jgi:hypothetical protein
MPRTLESWVNSVTHARCTCTCYLRVITSKRPVAHSAAACLTCAGNCSCGMCGKKRLASMYTWHYELHYDRKHLQSPPQALGSPVPGTAPGECVAGSAWHQCTPHGPLAAPQWARQHHAAALPAVQFGCCGSSRSSTAAAAALC